MIKSNIVTRNYEEEAAKAKKGQILPDGRYLDERNNPDCRCQIIVRNGLVYYQDECNNHCKGPATKTNVKKNIIETRACLREFRKFSSGKYYN